jgi:hypothetical protein
VGEADHLESFELLGIEPVEIGDPEVIVDDERANPWRASDAVPIGLR